jgi:hypothetical protein
MRADDPLAVAAVAAIRAGELSTVQRLLADNPGLANAQIEGRRGGYRTPLHVVADWPGYFPNGPACARLLLAAGADVNGGAEGFGRQETPLHWAASSDDVDVAEALIGGGADIDCLNVRPDDSLDFRPTRIRELVHLVKDVVPVGRFLLHEGSGRVVRLPHDDRDVREQNCVHDAHHGIDEPRDIVVRV